MIKKLLLIGASVASLLVGCSNAGYLRIGLTPYDSVYDNNYSLTAIKGGNFTTNLLGTTKQVLALKNDILFRWTPEGKPYVYTPDFQGYYRNFFSCDPFTTENGSSWNAMTNCTSNNFDGDRQTILVNFFNQLKTDDLVYYYYNKEDAYGNGGSYLHKKNLTVCFNSSYINKSICFIYANCSQAIVHSCDLTPTKGELVNSKGYQNLTFGSIKSNDRGPAPGQGSYQGGNTVIPNNVYTGQYCQTMGEMMQGMGSQYNTGFCYSNDYTMSGFNIVNKTPVFIEDAFSSYAEFTNAIDKYYQYCTPPATTEACNTAFAGKDDQREIINKMLRQNNIVAKKLWNYCHMSTYDPNATNCVASGYIAEQPTHEEMIEDIIRNNNANNIVMPANQSQLGDTNIYNQICPDDNPNCYQTTATWDVFGHLSNIYTKITGIFNGRSGKTGIIPPYILWIGMLIIFFTAIFKK